MPPISRLLRANQQQSARWLAPSADEEGACELAALERDGVWVAKLREQSQNVYENKGSAQKSTTPNPSFSKEANSGLVGSPLQMRSGGGSLGLGVKPEFPSRTIATASVILSAAKDLRSCS